MKNELEKLQIANNYTNDVLFFVGTKDENKNKLTDFLNDNYLDIEDLRINNIEISENDITNYITMKKYLSLYHNN